VKFNSHLYFARATVRKVLITYMLVLATLKMTALEFTCDGETTVLLTIGSSSGRRDRCWENVRVCMEVIFLARSH
jgi:hypothetical protein